ncbi:MAG: hypothetical protein KGH89_07290 [Thaumarchaeota archaeon]|nr:hypothetical protein [Nitrososphaerota archaeon]MDE1866397.1 hypothetical protein [Nitrososphaerota archaeon]
MRFFLVLPFALAIIGINSAYGYGEISASDFKIVDSLGEEINSPVVDQQLNLQTSLKNVSQNNVNWAYIVQVIDSDGATSDLNYATGSLVSNQTLTAALSWTPHASGTYKIQVLVWDNLRDIDPLAPISTFNITVT